MGVPSFGSDDAEIANADAALLRRSDMRDLHATCGRSLRRNAAEAGGDGVRFGLPWPEYVFDLRRSGAQSR